MDFIGSEITKKMVDPVQSLGIVTAGTAIGNSELFPGMGMIKIKRSVLGHCQALDRFLQGQTDRTEHG